MYYARLVQLNPKSPSLSREGKHAAQQAKLVQDKEGLVKRVFGRI